MTEHVRISDILAKKLLNIINEYGVRIRGPSSHYWRKKPEEKNFMEICIPSTLVGPRISTESRQKLREKMKTERFNQQFNNLWNLFVSSVNFIWVL